MIRKSKITIYLLTLYGIIMLSGKLSAQDKEPEMIKWSIATELPPAPGNEKQPGLAGAFIGISNEALLMAGGANFPGKMPWEGGEKVYHREIYVLKKDNKDQLTWISAGLDKLPAGIAYGASVSTPWGIVCVGGETDTAPVKDAFIMEWNAPQQVVQLSRLPDLPVALTALSMAFYANKVYVTGGFTGIEASGKFWSLDLQSEHPQWQSLPDLPVPMSHSAMVAQSDGDHTCLYVMGGRRANEEAGTAFYNYIFRYDIRKQEWKVMTSIGAPGATTNLAAASAIAMGSNYILLIGGDVGNLFMKLEELTKQTLSGDSATVREKAAKERIDVLNGHPGFNKTVYLYNTITDVWTTAGDLSCAPVTTSAVKWGKDIYIPCGEIRPGIRSPSIWKGVLPGRQIFSWLDTLVLLLCFLLMTLGRYWLTGNTENTVDYFKGGQRIPQWAAGISIFGAKLSAITFMGIPAKTFATNWTYFFYLLSIVMIMPFVARFFIPFYRRLNVTSAYEYLSRRFNNGTRMIASTLFILLQLGRMGIVVLLPSIALTLVTGININLCILLIGLISIFFTVKGGIEAVIWVEVIQVLVLASGALLCLFYIPFHLNDWEGGLQALKDQEKLKVFDFRFNFTESTFWVVLIGGLAIQLLTYGTDQTTVQRYLITKTEKESVRSLRMGAWLTVPSTLVFFSIGTLLFLFFREHPQQVNVTLENQDNIFPWFIVSQLPAGLSGLLIAGIFSASLSSTEASMNSTATLLTMDFYKRFRPGINDRQTLLFARLITLALGIFVTGIALYMAHEGVSSLWDRFNTILGLFTGCIGGAYLLGIFTKRASGAGVMAGMLFSSVAMIWIQFYTSIHLLLYAFTGLAFCFVSGYLCSLLLPPDQKDIRGLTVYKT